MNISAISNHLRRVLRLASSEAAIDDAREEIVDSMRLWAYAGPMREGNRKTTTAIVDNASAAAHDDTARLRHVPTMQPVLKVFKCSLGTD
jgi:hypothetical protein